MSGIAQATIVGNACFDPELKTSDAGSSYCRMRIACDIYNRAKKERVTQFFTIVAFGKTAESFADWCRKGSAVSIVGTMEADSSDDERYKDRVTIIVESFSIHTNRPAGQDRGDAYEGDDRDRDRDSRDDRGGRRPEQRDGGRRPDSRDQRRDGGRDRR